MNKKIFLILICVFTLVVLCSLMSFAQVRGEDTLDQIVGRGKLLVSTELGNMPWVFQDPKTSEITGFIIELTRMYAKEIGVELEIKTFEWAGVIPALTTGKVDMVAAPLSRTMPRTLKILYCEPYIIAPGAGQALKGKFKDISEINKKGVIITTGAGSNAEIWAKDYCTEATVIPLPSQADCIAAILSGRADVHLVDYIISEKIVQANPSLETIPGYTFMDSFACAIRLDDSFKLWASFNMFMRLIKLDGRYAQLYKKWLGIEWKPNSIEMSL
ncbi:amino acid ABC transporter substrate-binding protein [Candidatus Atribacteria bacterium HGW-Atribacteria-1]|nr:MAG: amino acid ABC transporter substrate-binding protein [Candidatus Atribacteria bacterium HGW-Atribacteria-1]